MSIRQIIYRHLYLKSLGWELTKFLRKERYCQRCGNGEKKRKIWMELHHLEYKWHNRNKILGMIIPNLWDDMETLCNRCHRLEHKRRNANG